MQCFAQQYCSLALKTDGQGHPEVVGQVGDTRVVYLQLYQPLLAFSLYLHYQLQSQEKNHICNITPTLPCGFSTSIICLLLYSLRLKELLFIPSCECFSMFFLLPYSKSLMDYLLASLKDCGSSSSRQMGTWLALISLRCFWNFSDSIVLFSVLMVCSCCILLQMAAYWLFKQSSPISSSETSISKGYSTRPPNYCPQSIRLANLSLQLFRCVPRKSLPFFKLISFLFWKGRKLKFSMSFFLSIETPDWQITERLRYFIREWTLFFRAVTSHLFASLFLCLNISLNFYLMPRKWLDSQLLDRVPPFPSELLTF